MSRPSKQLKQCQIVPKPCQVLPLGRSHKRAPLLLYSIPVSFAGRKYAGIPENLLQKYGERERMKSAVVCFCLPTPSSSSRPLPLNTCSVVALVVGHSKNMTAVSRCVVLLGRSEKVMPSWTQWFGMRILDRIPVAATFPPNRHRHRGVARVFRAWGTGPPKKWWDRERNNLKNIWFKNKTSKGQTVENDLLGKKYFLLWKRFSTFCRSTFYHLDLLSFDLLPFEDSWSSDATSPPLLRYCINGMGRFFASLHGKMKMSAGADVLSSSWQSLRLPFRLF